LLADTADTLMDVIAAADRHATTDALLA